MENVFKYKNNVNKISEKINEIEALITELNSMSNSEQLTFEYKIKRVDKTKSEECNHLIWYYYGSFDVDSLRCENENDEEFQYNVYYCLNCGKYRIEFLSTYEDFEKNNMVFKSYNCSDREYEEKRNFYKNNIGNYSDEKMIKKLLNK